MNPEPQIQLPSQPEREDNSRKANDEEVMTVALMQLYPDFFVREILGNTLWQKQNEIAIALARHKRVAVRSCHGMGKSYIAGRMALWFLYAFDGAKVITTAPSFRQVIDVLWREIRQAHVNSRSHLPGAVSLNKIQVNEEKFAIGLSTNEPDRFQGFHAENILLIVDEAAGVNEDIFVASEGIISSENARVLYIGNPTSLAGSFYAAFKSPNYVKISVSAFDTPNFTHFGIVLEDILDGTWRNKVTGPMPWPYLVTPEWVADKVDKWGVGSPMWDARVMGTFPKQSDTTLIPLALIEAAAAREILVADDAEEAIGADIARFGIDKTIFLWRKGNVVMDIKQLPQQSTMVTVNELKMYMDFHPAAATFIDEVGIGAGVVDRMKQIEEVKIVEGVNVGREPYNKDQFTNLRAELYWRLRDRFVKGDIVIPHDEDLMSQLANIEFKYDVRGRIQIESKEEIKKRGLPSPDRADALVLAFMVQRDTPGVLGYYQAEATDKTT